MILSICSEPKILEILKIINLLLGIIRVVVPIILIISLMIKLLSAMTKNDSDILSSVKKSAIPSMVAAVIIFLIPNIVDIIVRISFPSTDYKACLSNITDEKIENAYIERIEDLISLAEETFDMNDYNNAYKYLKNIKDVEKKSEYELRLSNLLNVIDELLDEKFKKDYPTSNTLKSTGLGKDIEALTAS